MSAPGPVDTSALDKLISRLEEVELELENINGEVWDHVPMLPECERPCGNAEVAVSNLRSYLEEQKEALKP